MDRWIGGWLKAGTRLRCCGGGFTKASLPVGTEIMVDGYRAKGNPFRANGRDLTFADGRKLFMGSSGTGAPSDGRDPTER